MEKCMTWIMLIFLCFALISILLLWGLSVEHSRFIHLKREKNQTEIKLHAKEHELEILFNQSILGIAFLDLDGRIQRVNKVLCEMMNASESELLAANYQEFIPIKTSNEIQIYLQELLNNKIFKYQALQEWHKKNNEKIWVKFCIALIREEMEKPAYFILQVENFTEQKRMEDHLKRMAFHDPLTSLANRNKFQQEITHTLALARRNKQQFALLYVDLDNFKNINDSFGHEEGDLILQIVGERLRNSLRMTDMIARLSGDEFALLITDVKRMESLAEIAQKLLANILQPIILKNQEVYLTASIGISLYPHDGHTVDSLMKHTDLALYRAKENGRNNFQFYTHEMTVKSEEKLGLESALKHALIKNEFILHYQPKMQINTRCITGVEALLRWKNEYYNFITPRQIILIAEETGLIIPVHNLIVKLACKQLKEWHDKGFNSLTMAINCSSHLFKHINFVEDLLSTISQLGLPSSALEIEVTEGTLLSDPENALRLLSSLKAAGMKIVIDDFGTGYWSLKNVKKLMVDKVKIDKMFIEQMHHDEISASIVKAILAMSKKLGIGTIAEGVERQDQYQYLAQEQCDEIQGYYLTQPLSSEKMTEFLRHPIPDAEVIAEASSP